MKIRMGFVSNSSSTSFCIYGIEVEKREFSFEQLCSETENNSLAVFDADDVCYIGREWSSIGDDETGKQFKESTKTILEKILGREIVPTTIDETVSN